MFEYMIKRSNLFEYIIKVWIKQPVALKLSFYDNKSRTSMNLTCATTNDLSNDNFNSIRLSTVLAISMDFLEAHFAVYNFYGFFKVI